MVTVVAYQSLWALGTRPQVVLALHSTLALVSTMVPKWQPFAGLLLATYAMSSRPRTRHTGALLAWLGAGLLSHSYASARLTSDPVRSTATLLLLWTALVAAIWVAGARQRQVVARARSAGELISSRADRELADERLRIARDLHDGVCAALTAIHLQAAGARAIGATSGVWPPRAWPPSRPVRSAACSNCVGSSVTCAANPAPRMGRPLRARISLRCPTWSRSSGPPACGSI